MAKVYDALKQVEAERSLQTRSAAVLGERVLCERLEAVLVSLDDVEHRAARRGLELSGALRQIVETRIDSLEREMGVSVATLGNQIRRDGEALRKRVTLLLAAVVMLVAIVLLK